MTYLHNAGMNCILLLLRQREPCFQSSDIQPKMLVKDILRFFNTYKIKCADNFHTNTVHFQSFSHIFLQKIHVLFFLLFFRQYI